MSRFSRFCLGLACISVAASAHAALIDFNDQPRGKIITNQYTASDGVTISAVNFTPGHPNDAILFDSNNHTSFTDTDLEFPWSTGNLVGNNTIRKLLIIAQNITDANHDGLVDDPNDEGGHPAGFLKFKFTKPQTSFGMDLIDIDGPEEISPTYGYVAFLVKGVEKARVGWGEFIDPKSKFYDKTVAYENRSANHIQPINVNELGMTTAFDEVDVNMGWSSGMDNVVFSSDISVIEPEPTMVALVAPMLLALRRRKGI